MVKKNVITISTNDLIFTSHYFRGRVHGPCGPSLGFAAGNVRYYSALLVAVSTHTLTEFTQFVSSTDRIKTKNGSPIRSHSPFLDQCIYFIYIILLFVLFRFSCVCRFSGRSSLTILLYTDRTCSFASLKYIHIQQWWSQNFFFRASKRRANIY